MRTSTKIWICLLALVLIGAVAALFAGLNPKDSGEFATITVNGEVVRTVNLSHDDTFVITSDYGSNTITVQDGAIAVSSADCPDGICVRTGAISAGGKPIVCLPHKLVIEVASPSDMDTTTQ